MCTERDMQYMGNLRYAYLIVKSVANHLADWLKVNREKTIPLIKKWSKLDNENSKWIIKRATRRLIT